MNINKIYWALFPFALAILIVSGFKIAEPYIFPVVSDFRVNQVIKTDGYIVIRGQTVKNRECILNNITAVGILDGSNLKPKLKLTFTKHDEFNTAGNGTKVWGPWEIKVTNYNNLQNVELYSNHSCHFAWNIVTHLVTMPITYINYNGVYTPLPPNE